MKIEITTNIPDFERLMQRKAAHVPRAVEELVMDAAALTIHESRNQLSEMVYNQPIPTTKSGKPAWKRSGNLMRQERMYISGRHEATIDNRAVYAQARHDLQRPSPIDHVVRKARWRETAAKNVEGDIRRLAEEAIRKLTD